MTSHQSLKDALDCPSCLADSERSPRCRECGELIVVSTQGWDELCLECLYKDDGHNPRQPRPAGRREIGQPPRGGPHEIGQRDQLRRGGGHEIGQPRRDERAETWEWSS